MKPRRMKATASERARYESLKNLGCIVNRLYFDRYIAPQIHHMTSGGRRISNFHTIPLSPWLHQAWIPQDCKTKTEATDKYGPSLETSKRDFEARFGSEEFLLAETNRLLEGM